MAYACHVFILVLQHKMGLSYLSLQGPARRMGALCSRKACARVAGNSSSIRRLEARGAWPEVVEFPETVSIFVELC